MRYTVDHGFIQQWIEHFGGLPVLRMRPDVEKRHITVRFGGGQGEVSPISWGEFFEWFEAEGLAFGVPDEEGVDPRYIVFANRDDVPLFPTNTIAENRPGDEADPFSQKLEWKYDKPHRD